MRIGRLALWLCTVLALMALTGLVSAQMTFTGGGAITVGATQTTGSSSTLTVSGVTGPVATVVVQLPGVTTDETLAPGPNAFRRTPAAHQGLDGTGFGCRGFGRRNSGAGVADPEPEFRLAGRGISRHAANAILHQCFPRQYGQRKQVWFGGLHVV